MGNKNITGADKSILILGSPSSGKTKLIQEIIEKKKLISNIDTRKSFTEQIFSHIHQLTQEVLKIFKKEKEIPKPFENLLKKFEETKEKKTLLVKIWCEDMFQIFQKNEAFKPYHSFLTKETLERISKSHYVPSEKDVKFCLGWKTIGTQKLIVNHNKEGLEFTDIGDDTNWEIETDLVIYLISLNDYDNDKVMNQTIKQFEDINGKLKKIPFILIFTKPEEMKEKVKKSITTNIPSFLGFD
jgi:GTPase SAR1 family protein